MPRTLSEHDSKSLIAAAGVPTARETLVPDAQAAVRAADALGYPVVLKLCGEAIAHKTERGLVRLGLRDADAVREAAESLLAARRPEDGPIALLVAEQVSGRRELIAGLVRDPQLGPSVLLGLGGILAEATRDVAFASAPLTPTDARRMMRALRSAHRLGPFRGEPAVDADALAAVLVALGRLGLERPDIATVDVNPLIVVGSRPVAVDALVVLGDARPEPPLPPAPSDGAIRARFQPLFHPRGVIVAGASSHPAKFGFSVFHNLLRCGFPGDLFPVNRDGVDILGRRTYREIADVPAGRADLVFVCTPPAANVEVLRTSARLGVRAAYVAGGGYGESGEEGRAREAELCRVADELGILLAGPNGQGVVSTPASLCAQMVAPWPPAGRIGIASQSGNLCSGLLNYAVLTGVGVSKAASTGNSAQTSIADYLEYLAVDGDTDVALAYVEGLGDGRRFARALRRLTAAKPLVLLRGGVAAEGQRAAASHTGALATDDRLFDGLCRQTGVLRAPTVEHAFEWAATLATQPLPRGRRVVVITTAGGWGVLAADACAGAGLDVIALPDDLRTRIDTMVPARWSRANPIDPAGGETRDTVPELLDIVCAHAEVDAVLLLGVGIQSNQAEMLRSGPFFPDHGLERITDFQNRQDRRYVEAAVGASERHRKPVLIATELAYTDRAYGNAGPLAVREAGRLCYPSAHRAVAALRAMVDWAEFSAARP
jgi:acetyltransferase